jgi:membrane-associated protease RseP (regulator of RpoE activity)
MDRAMLTSLRIIGATTIVLGLSVGSAAAQSGGGGRSGVSTGARALVDTTIRISMPVVVQAAQPAIVSQILEKQRELEGLSLNAPERHTLVTQINELTERVDSGVATGVYQQRDAIAVKWRLSPEVVNVTPAQQDAFVRSILPTGMMGFYVNAAGVHEIRPTGWFVRYYAHPVVVFVVPDSPADRGGLSVGDSVIAFNDRDVRERLVNLKTMNHAGNAVTVSVVNAAGQPRRITLVNAPVSKEAQELRAKEVGIVIDNLKPVRRPSMVPPGGNGGVFGMTGLGDTIRMAVMNGVLAGRGGVYSGGGAASGRGASPSPMLVATVRSGGPLVHGMRVSALNAQLRDRDELKNGVYVDSVAAGSPALRWGFHPGDVLVRVGDQPVLTVADARRLIVVPPPGQTLKVEVRRKGDKKTVEIKTPKAK